MSSSQGDALSAAVDHLHVDGNMETPARADENEQPQPRASIAVPAWLKRAMRPTIAIVNDGAATNGIEDEGDDKDGMTQGGEEEPDWLTDAYSALPDEAKRRRRTTIAPNALNVDNDDEPAWLSTATETLQRGVRRIRKSIALVARVARLSATKLTTPWQALAKMMTPGSESPSDLQKTPKMLLPLTSSPSPNRIQAWRAHHSRSTA